jgi:DNA-binding phage protein
MAATAQAQAEATKAAQRAGQQAAGVAQIAKETGLTRQTVYRIKGDPAGC